MRPETVARRRRERAERRAQSRAALIARLAEKAEQEGPGSIWAEMLAEARAR